jgi:WD40 repeat protein
VTGPAQTRHAEAHSWRLDIDEPALTVHILPEAILATGTEGALLLTDLDGRERWRQRLGRFTLSAAVSPDGTRLAIGADSHLTLIDLPTTTVLRECPTRWCAALAWAANSRELAAADGKQVRVLDRVGHRYWTSPPLPSTVTGLTWLRRDARRLAAAAYQGVTIYEPATSRVAQHLAAPGAIAGLAVAPNGRWIVGGSQDATLHGWRVPAGNDFRMSGFPSTVSQLAFDPTGRWLANDAADSLTLWDFSGPGPTGRDALVAEGHPSRITAFTWARACGPGETIRELYSGDDAGNLALWRVHPHHRPGDRIRPTGILDTGDPVTALTTNDTQLISGHRSGALRCHPRSSLAPPRRTNR